MKIRYERGSLAFLDTWRGACGFVVFLIGVSLFPLVGAGAPPMAIFCVLAGAASSIRILYRLGKLEQEGQEPSEAAKLAYNAALFIGCFTAGCAALFAAYVNATNQSGLDQLTVCAERPVSAVRESPEPLRDGPWIMVQSAP